MNIPEKNFCVPATINQYLAWADANDLHEFAFSNVLTGNWLKNPDEASFILRDLLSGFMSSELLRKLFYSTHKDLEYLLVEAFSKESSNEQREYSRLVIQAEVVITNDMADTYYSFVGVSDEKKKSSGESETYDLAYEPVRNLLNLKVSFADKIAFSDTRKDKSEYGFHVGYPNIRLIDVLQTIFDDLTFGGGSDDRKNVEKEKLKVLLEERMDNSSDKFYTMDEVKNLLKKKTQPEGFGNG